MTTNMVWDDETAEDAAPESPLGAGVRVNFVIVGAMKAGTTALDSFLAQHPDICTSPLKETHFFATDMVFEGDGEPDYTWYHCFFDNYTGQKLIGEATPKYMFHPHVPARLQAYNPEMKLIFMLRHPVERAYSHYIMSVEQGYEPLSFSEAIRQEESRLRAAAGNHDGDSPLWWQSYVSRGRYMAQIHNMLRSFPREQMLFIRSEDLSQRHRETLRQVYDFLGVADVGMPEERSVLAQKYDMMSQIDRSYLVELFSQELDALEQFLGWDLSAWRT